MDDKNIPVLPEEPLKIGLSLALDLGTETVGAYLYDAASGKCLASAGAPNAQKIFGESLKERIAYGENDQKFLRETAVIREQVYDLILELCRKASESRSKKPEEGTEAPAQTDAEGKMSGNAPAPYSFTDIHYVSVAGNTVMEHFYGAVSPRSIGIPPYDPVTLFGEQIIAEPTMYFSPCISGFVGGDITAGLVSTGLAEQDEMSLYIDLGKGFGMALGNRAGFLCGAGAEPGEIPAVFEKLLKERGIRVDNIERTVLAGAFGAEAEDVKAAVEKAFSQAGDAQTVLQQLLQKAEFRGNAAGYGACLVLTGENREKLKKTAAMCRAVS